MVKKVAKTVAKAAKHVCTSVKRIASQELSPFMKQFSADFMKNSFGVFIKNISRSFDNPGFTDIIATLGITILSIVAGAAVMALLPAGGIMALALSGAASGAVGDGLMPLYKDLGRGKSAGGIANHVFESATYGAVTGLITGVAGRGVDLLSDGMRTAPGRKIIDVVGNTMIDFVDDVAHTRFLPKDNDIKKERESTYILGNSVNSIVGTIVK